MWNIDVKRSDAKDGAPKHSSWRKLVIVDHSPVEYKEKMVDRRRRIVDISPSDGATQYIHSIFSLNKLCRFSTTTQLYEI